MVNSTNLALMASTALIWLVGVVRYWMEVFQQNFTAVAITLAVVSMLLFFTLVGIIILLIVQNRQMAREPRLADFGTGFHTAQRPTLYNLIGYRPLFLALENGLSREGVLDLAFKLDVTLEWGDSVPKSRVLREVMLELEREGRMGQLYMLVTSDPDYSHIQNELMK